jgi:hypothetical protein
MTLTDWIRVSVCATGSFLKFDYQVEHDVSERTGTMSRTATIR